MLNSTLLGIVMALEGTIPLYIFSTTLLQDDIMLRGFKCWLLVGCFLSTGVLAEQTALTVVVKKVESNEGEIAIAIYRDKDNWLDTDFAFLKKRVKAQSGETRIFFPSLPIGEYAIAVYHDENGDGSMDTNFIGIPTEGAGASRDAEGNFGPPSFEDAVFNFKESSTTVIHLNY